MFTFFRRSLRHSVRSLLISQHQQVCHFFPNSRQLVFSSVFPFTLIFLADLTGTVFSLSSCSIRPQWVAGPSFLSGNDADDELARRRELLVPSAILCSLSLLSSIVYNLVFFSDWRRTNAPSSRSLCSLLSCCCCLPNPFRGMGAWRKTMEPQKQGNSPGSGPKS